MHYYASVDVITRAIGEDKVPDVSQGPRAGWCRQIRPGIACTTFYEVRAGCNEARPGALFH